MSEDPQKKAKRYFALSFGWHIGLFVFMVIAGLVFTHKPITYSPSVRIDMVALPDQVKTETQEPLDTSLPVKKDAPPPPPIETPPEEDALALPKEKDTPKPDKAAEKRAQQALAKLREQMRKDQINEQKKQLEKRKEDLKRLEETYRAAIRGNQVNEGNSRTGAMEATRDAYVGHIVEKLRSNWSLPVYLQGKGLNASVRIYIDARGEIVRVQFVQNSGNEAFDSYVKGSVQKSAPFAPPPEELAKGLRNGGIEVGYPIL